MRELPSEEAAELRDAIRQLSQTVSASAGTPVSHTVIDRLQQLQGEVDHLKLLSNGKNGKDGNLAYRADDIQRSRPAHDAQSDLSPSDATPTSQHEVFSTPMVTAPNTLRKLQPELSSDNQKYTRANELDAKQQLASSTVATNEPRITADKGSLKANSDDDDFMAVAPAQVEHHWGPSSAAAGASSSLGSSEDRSVQEIALPSGLVAHGLPKENQPEPRNLTGESSTLSTARRLFQESMFRQAVYKLRPNGDSTSGQRPQSSASAPEMDLPLSDTDE